MEEIDSVRPVRSRALRAAALIVTSFAALVAGAVAAGAAGGNLRVLAVIAGFAVYLLLFGRAVREFDLDRIAWDHPDSRLLLRVSGKSPFAGHRP
jgi:fatty acid desaturase